MTNENKEIFPVVAVIPSLNPDEKLVNTIEGLLKVGFTDIIVVDDGSNEEGKNVFNKIKKMGGGKVSRA